MSSKLNKIKVIAFVQKTSTLSIIEQKCVEKIITSYILNLKKILSNILLQ